MHNNGYSSLLLTLPAASSHFVLVSSRKVLAILLSSVYGGKFAIAQFAILARVLRIFATHISHYVLVLRHKTMAKHEHVEIHFDKTILIKKYSHNVFICNCKSQLSIGLFGFKL